MADLNARIAASPASDISLTPFSASFTGMAGVEVFEVVPEVHGSSKPLVGPVVTKGKQMVARAAAPMVAGLGEQVAVSLAEIQRVLDQLLEEQARLSAVVADLERRLGSTNGGGPTPPK